ncbi:MAG: hypothetical protein IPK35_22285 [Saprospiraceae bacterium]|nr:hypothetical protein [Saprospiraceae bacterium]
MFESEVLASCPISKGPSEVIKYLENLKGFQRNKEYDFGNGSIRFNAKNAKLNGFDLIDDKSLFLLNFDTNNENSYEGWWLFQAIYYYNKSGDKEIELNRILKVLNENLRLKKEIHYDGLGNPYERYTLSNETGFNLKHGSRNNQHIIDILWAPPEK